MSRGVGQYRVCCDIIVNTGEANVTETLCASFWFKSKLKRTVMVSPAATHELRLLISNCRIEEYVNGKSMKDQLKDVIARPFKTTLKALLPL